MTSKTGNKGSLRRRRDGGLSLIELLITVCFVALGTMVLQGGFLRASDVLGRYENTLSIGHWLNQASAASREELLYTEEGASSGSGTANAGSKNFEWERVVEPFAENLYSVRHIARWKEGGRPMELKQETYAFKKDIPQR